MFNKPPSPGFRRAHCIELYDARVVLRHPDHDATGLVDYSAHKTIVDGGSLFSWAEGLGFSIRNIRSMGKTIHPSLIELEIYQIMGFPIDDWGKVDDIYLFARIRSDSLLDIHVTATFSDREDRLTTEYVYNGAFAVEWYPDE